jgi:hypothetical protein
LMCSSASSLVLFTTVLELPLAMMLAAVVLLVIDRQLLGAERCRRKERGGGVAWVGSGSPSNGRYPLAWVRCGAEFYLPVPLGRSAFVRFLALFLFPSFPELYHTSSYLDFRVYLSDLHKCP